MPTKKRTRSDSGDYEGDFQDPLQNYDEPEYADALERALIESSITEMERTPFETFPITITVGEALQTMAEKDYFCLMIADEDGKLVGVFTERDVLNRVADHLAEVKDKPISELMTKEPRIVYETDPPAKALNIMAIGGFRHVPVLNVEDKPVGIIGPTRTVRFLFDHVHEA